MGNNVPTVCESAVNCKPSSCKVAYSLYLVAYYFPLQKVKALDYCLFLVLFELKMLVKTNVTFSCPPAGRTAGRKCQRARSSFQRATSTQTISISSIQVPNGVLRSWGVSWRLLLVSEHPSPSHRRCVTKSNERSTSAMQLM